MMIFHTELQADAYKGEPKPGFCMLIVWEVSLEIE